MHYTEATRKALRDLEDGVTKIRQEVRESIQEATEATERARDAARGLRGDPARQEAERSLVEVSSEGRERLRIAKQEASRAKDDLKQVEKDRKAERDRVAEEDSEPGFTSEVVENLAEQLIAKFFSHWDGEPTFRFWAKNWWTWAAGTWTVRTPEEINDEVRIRLTRSDPRGLAIQKLPAVARDNIVVVLRDLLKLPDGQEFETWLPCYNIDNPTWDVAPETDDGPSTGTWVCTSKEIIRVDLEKKIKLDSTPRYWTTCAIPRSMGNPQPSEWCRFLHQVLEGDQQRIDVLQEWFGYCCFPSTQFQKLLMLVGEGGNGKSTVLNVLKAMIGKSNVSSCSLENLADKHGTFITWGKLVNSYDDISTRYMHETGHLKSYTGGGDVVFERKYCDPFSSKPTARLCFSMNAVPRTEDDSQGFWRRLLIVPFRFTPKEEIKALASLDHPECPFPAEMDDIFAWSLVGLCRLLRQRGFTESKVCQQELEFWRGNNENVRRYCDERLIFNPEATDIVGSTSVIAISHDYAAWNKLNREKPFSTQALTVRLKRIYSKEGKLEIEKFPFGQRQMAYYVGLSFNPKAPTLSLA